MLVLSREIGESIMIGDDITITIVDIRGDKVRLGIEAPREIPVHRNEVYEAIRREKQRQDAENKRLKQVQDTENDRPDYFEIDVVVPPESGSSPSSSP